MGPLARLSPARRNLVLVIALVVVIVAGVLVGRSVLGGDDDVQPVAQNQLGPVLLVSGYGSTPDSLSVMSDFLTEAGHDVTLVDLGDTTGDLNDEVTALRSAVTQTLDESRAPAVDLVGYSAGGVVVRLFVAEQGADAMTRRVVTLGSPHHGTDIAALGGNICPVACQQLAPNSDLLRELNRGDETPSGPLWVSIWTDDDQTVVPPTSAVLDGALDYAVQDVCADLTVSHGELPRTVAVLRMVAAGLGTDQPSLPGGAVCG